VGLLRAIYERRSNVDLWKFFDITHREHVICNPMSVERFEDLIALLRLSPGDRVLEIATGKGEFILRLAERYRAGGVGVDLSPYCSGTPSLPNRPTESLRNLVMPAYLHYTQKWV
jgi:hypothetical protein